MIERYEYSPSGERFVFGRPATIQTADINWDGACDVLDLSIVATDYDDSTTLELGDATGDLVTDVLDLSIFSMYYGQSVEGLSLNELALYPQPGSTLIDEAISAGASNTNTLSHRQLPIDERLQRRVFCRMEGNKGSGVFVR